MSGFLTMRRLLAGAVLLSCAATGSLLLAQGTTPPATAPAPRPLDPNAPIAEINGREINNKLFHDLMMQVAGMRVFQQVFDLAVVQQACTQAGIPLEGDEFKKRMDEEMEKTLNAIQIATADGKPPTKEDRERALNEVLRQRGITAVEFRMGLETRAGLRALAKGKWESTTTPQQVTDAWEAEYGPRRTVLIIGSPDEATDAKLRTAIVDAKKKPEEAAQELKLGVQPVTISDNAKNVDALKTTVFAMRGENTLSSATTVPGNGGTQRVLVFLQKIEGDRRAANKLEGKVKSDFEAKVNEFNESKWMNDHLQRLKQTANVKINDPVLSQQFQAIDAAIRAQTQPATPGATTPPVAPAVGGTTPPGGVTPPEPTPGRSGESALPNIQRGLPTPGRN